MFVSSAAYNGQTWILWKTGIGGRKPAEVKERSAIGGDAPYMFAVRAKAGDCGFVIDLVGHLVGQFVESNIAMEIC